MQPRLDDAKASPRTKGPRAAEPPDRPETGPHRAGPAAVPGGPGSPVRSAGISILGASTIARFFLTIAQQGPPMRLVLRQVNGLPAQLGEGDVPQAGPRAPRWVMLIDLDDQGRIAWIRSVLAPQKRGKVSWRATEG